MMLSNNELLNEKLIYLILGTFVMCKLFLQHQGNSFKSLNKFIFFLISIACFVFNHVAVFLKTCVANHTTHSLPALSKSNCSNKFDFHKQLVCISRATSLFRTQCPNITSNNPTSVNYVQWIFGGQGGVKRGHIHIILNV